MTGSILATMFASHSVHKHRLITGSHVVAKTTGHHITELADFAFRLKLKIASNLSTHFTALKTVRIIKSK